MTYLLVALGLLAAAIAVVLILASFQPDTFRVKRSVTIQAPAEAIYPHIVDFRKWPGWSPFEKMDPAMKKSYSGVGSGTGAVYEWDGNSSAGKGRSEITEAVAPSKVAMNLHFDRPFKCDNTVLFTLEPQGAATTVTWDMQGPSAFMSKVMGVFINMERMVGSQFEEGLGNLKMIAEK